MPDNYEPDMHDDLALPSLVVQGQKSDGVRALKRSHKPWTYERRMRREVSRIVSEYLFTPEYAAISLSNSILEVCARAFRAGWECGNIAPRASGSSRNVKDELRVQCRMILALVPLAVEHNPDVPAEAIVSWTDR